MRHILPPVLLALALIIVVGGSTTAPPPVYPTTAADTALGFILKAHRTALGLTQDSLSKLTGRTVTTTKISRLERGLDTATVAQQDSLALAIMRATRRRIPPAAITRFNDIVRRTWVRGMLSP